MRCIEQMNGTLIAGRAIKVNLAQQAGSGAAAGSAMAHLPPQLNAATGTSLPGGLLVGAGGSGSAVSSLDGLAEAEGKGGGVERMGASQRASLLMKLAQNAGVEVPDATRKAAAQMPSTHAGVDSSGLAAGGAGGSVSNRCVVLKNMFDRLSDEATSNPNFFAELAEDVRSECAKLGTVLFVSADKWSNGFIYVKMLADADAARVLDTMHGRYFAKNKILAAYVPEEQLDKKFKLAGLGSRR
jgi:hypothetical protein